MKTTLATLIVALLAISAIGILQQAHGQNEGASLDLVLPTDNDALFHGGGPDFYQYIERDYHGEKSTPWEGGQYGFVRDPEQTSAGVVYRRFHEGIDIRCLHRDEGGEPIDEVHAIADGKVVYANLVPGWSNYGKYIVIEHRWGGSPYYSLYGHLSKIEIHTGEQVQRGQHIAVMGYTGTGLSRERAHLHLELNLMLNPNFLKWYDAFVATSDPNRHGIYNGINLVGMNIARLYLELRENPSLTIPQFLAEEETFYKVALPKSRHFELPTLYPWMLSGASDSEPPAWVVSYARSGLPLRIEAGERKVKKPELVYVKPSLRHAAYLVDGIATGPATHAHLTEHGEQVLELLVYPR